MMQRLTREMLDGLWPNAIAALKDGVIATQDQSLPVGEIDSSLRLAHFMAQISHESEGGSRLEENLNYSAERLMQVWPARFPTEMEAKTYAHAPEAIANKVYNGRMGNRIGTSDGWAYRGRGLLQITGRDKYFEVGVKTDLDLLSHPEFANDPQHALRVACAAWFFANANGGADDDSVQRVTRRINGGLNGLQSRQGWLAKWKGALKV